MSELKPDIIIPYIPDENDVSPYAMVYVRPQTNKLNYEKAIIVACQKFGDVIYLANINGKIFIKNVLILDHYSTQYYFSIHSKTVIGEYPEMVECFEKHFKTSFEKSDIISSFDAQLRLKLSAEELFNTIVGDKDFLKLYGQTIKKINGYYVVNYDIPAIISKYTPESDVFVVGVKITNPDTAIDDINQTIFDNLKKDLSTPIIDEDKLSMLKWNDMVRRTYHISCNHIATAFDMSDFIFNPDGTVLDFYNIPLTRYLIDNKIVTLEEIRQIKKFNLVYKFCEDGSEKLINILDEGNNQSIEESIELFKKINLKRLRTSV